MAKQKSGSIQVIKASKGSGGSSGSSNGNSGASSTALVVANSSIVPVNAVPSSNAASKGKSPIGSFLSKLDFDMIGDILQTVKLVVELKNELKSMNQVAVPANLTEPIRLDVAQTEQAIGGAQKALEAFKKGFNVFGQVADVVVNVVGKIDEYKSALNQAQASTGAGEAEMAQIKSSATSLYKQNLGEGWGDVVGTLTEVKQLTGEQGAALEETTRNAMIFSDVFKTDVKDSAKSAKSVMKEFGISGKEAYNLFAQGSQKGLGTDELLESADKYGSSFKEIGFSASQMFDTFGAGLKSGSLDLGAIGDSVKAFSEKSKEGGEESRNAFAALGLNAGQMVKTFAAGGPEAQAAFKQVAQALGNVQDPILKSKLGVQLFGESFKDLGDDVLTAMGSTRSEFDMTKDTMNEMASVKYNTIGDAFKGLGRQLTADFLFPLADMAIPLLEKLSEVIMKVGPIVKNVFGSIASTVGPVITGVADNVAYLFQNGFDGKMMGVAFDYAKMLGLRDSDAVMIVQSIASVFDKVSGMKDLFIGTWQSFIPHIQSIFLSIGSIIQQVLPVIMKVGAVFYNLFISAMAALLPVGAYLMGKIWPIISQIFTFLSVQVFPVLTKAVSDMLPAIYGLGNAIIQAFSTLFTIIKPVLDSIFSAVQFVFTMIQGGVSTVMNSFGSIVNSVIQTLTGATDFITNVFAGNWSAAWQGLMDMLKGIFSTIGNLVAVPINGVIGMVNEVIKAINNIKIEIPEWSPWAGGKTFSANITPITPIGGFAKGGVVSSPTIAWIGEGGDREVIIPINNSDRSRGLYAAAGRMLGVSPAGSASSGSGAFVFNPSYNFYGNADQAAVQQMEQRTRRDFEREFNTYLRQKARVSFV
ncbi:phage tail tape measure protein [Paenibacillus chitinolyticus]|uniref:hypothetical protein n=1 Tax=Paenibacillus chitinolyticus TaxID=79263 RepID=UPI00363580A3